MRDQDSRATVSVIIPCFNYGHYLPSCLDSVLSQQGVNLKVLVIDDLSTDDSASVATRLCAQDDRIEFRRHRDNRGLIATANEGLEWADGDHVVLLSADDLLVPGSLCRAAAIMKEHPDVGLVYGRPLLARDDGGLPKPSGRWRSTDIWHGEDWIRTRCSRAESAMSSPEVVVRNSVQRAVGGYDSRCQHTSDVNMWLRVAAVSDIAYVRGVPQAIYRVHGASMQRSHVGPLVDLRERKAAFEAFFGDCGSLLAEPGRLETQARRAMAAEALLRACRTIEGAVTDEQKAVSEYVEFALAAYPDARQLSGCRWLKFRRRLGMNGSRRFPPFLATRAGRRVTFYARRMRWRYQGV